MRTKLAVSLLMVGACSDVSVNGTQQEVADPAPVLSIVDASFQNQVGGNPVNFCGQGVALPCATPPSVQIRWGQPVVATNQSGLGFEKTGAHTVVYGANFALGDLTHFNWPTVSDTSSTSVELALHLRVEPSVPGAALFDQTISIPLAIDDTPNVDPCAYPSTQPCADKITFGTSSFQLVSTSGTTVYELAIQGFVDVGTTNPVSGLISDENGSTTASLIAVVNEHCVDADEDGACDETDNCPGVSNDQTDSDGDGDGDACDTCPLDANNDADGDGVCGNVDNCPTIPNPDQSNGCQVEQTCPCDGDWPNHGQYVSCVAKETTRLVHLGLMTHQERSVIVSTAGQSICGK